MRLNLDEIEPVIVLCKKLGVSKINFLRLVLHGRAQINENEIMLPMDEIEQLKSKLISLKKNSDITIRIGVPLSVNDGCHKCEAANGKLNIKYDGYVFPCEVFKNDRVGILNNFQPECIYDSSLQDIYTNSSYLKYVRDYSQKFLCDKHCETCVGQYMINQNKEKN